MASDVTGLIAELATLEGRMHAAVADLTALAAVSGTALVDAGLYPCEDIGTGEAALYLYDSASTAASSPPDVVVVTAGGRMILQGDEGTELNPRGAYVAETTYRINDIVSNSGSSYVSLQSSNTGHTPGAGGSEAWWSILVAKGAAGTNGAAGAAGFGLYPDVLAIFDNTAALPIDPDVGARYIAGVTANGWTAGRIYQCVTEHDWTGATETTPANGGMVHVTTADGSLRSQDLRYNDGWESQTLIGFVAESTYMDGGNETGATIPQGSVVVLRGIEVGGARAADITLPLITGVNDTNSDGGVLHSTIVDDTGGAFHLDLFSDAGKLALVAHTASADPDGTAEAALVADNASGIGGLLVIGNTPTAGAFTLTVPYSSSPGVKLAPTGSTAPLAVALLDINDGESAPSILSGAGGMGSSGAVPAPLKVLVQDSENVRIGDLLTLSATTAGQCEANGAGQPVAQATECLVGVAGTGAGVLCACVRNFISTPIGS